MMNQRQRALAGAIAATIVLSCATTTERDAVVIAPDGRSQVSLPAGWEVRPRPGGGSPLFVQSEDSQASVTISSFDKEPGMTLDEYASGLHELIEEKYSPFTSQTLPQEISGGSLRGVQWNFGSKRTRQFFVHVTIEGPQYMHQLFAEISLESAQEMSDQIEDRSEQIEEILRSFRER